MARSYKRDKNGKFSGSGGSSARKGKGKAAADAASEAVTKRKGYKNQKPGKQTAERLKARAAAKKEVKAAANKSRSQKATTAAARQKALKRELEAQRPFVRGKSAEQIGKMQAIAFKRVNRKFG